MEALRAGQRRFLTPAGEETDMIFLRKVDLPNFALFTAVLDAGKRAQLRAMQLDYLGVAAAHQLGFIAATPTWRAARTHVEAMGLDFDQVVPQVAKGAGELLDELSALHAKHGLPLVRACDIGPAADGYKVEQRLTAQQAADLHFATIEACRQGARVELVQALTMTYPDEAAGVALAAQRAGLPASISFTVETDGRLPDGTPLKDAIQIVCASTTIITKKKKRYE